MSSHKFDPSNLKGKLAGLKRWFIDRHIPPRLMFFIVGILSTIWFIVRVIPKPSRAAYPCMRVAAPLMSGFVLYLLSLGGLTFFVRRVIRKLKHSQYLAAGYYFLIALIISGISITSDTSFSSAQTVKKSGPDDGPNEPVGKGSGINPGLVTWAWNPDATNENCRNVMENSDWYFNPVNADQKLIGDMISGSVLKIAGKSDLKRSWDALFRYHNQKKYSKNRGYTPGEKIFIKINQGTASWIFSQQEKDNGYVFATTAKGAQTRRLRNRGATETSPYVVLELLRELVNHAGVKQADIVIGDPIAHIFGHNYEIWHSEFPDVIYIDRFSEKFGRTLTRQTENELIHYSDKKFSDKLYDVIEKADYMINVASLKPHGSAGISLTAKNHFGSQGRPSAAHLHYSLIAPTWETFPREAGNASNGGYRKYRVMVDIMGSRYLGQNTMLYIVDGLFGGGADETKGPVKYFMEPFNGDWSSSIFMSQDQVALESVCYDFLRTEWDGVHKHDPSNSVFEIGPSMYGVDDYLHQAADSKNWPEGIIYDPDNCGQPLASLGVHEHWNNAIDKQYSGNLGRSGGITLVSVPETLVKGGGKK
ncbi:MAG: DUF362 domain-containing protein [Bacteroidales bacterium]|nr:DUF362 domain-containing protein [Bacteroidales bacterium]